MQRSCLRLLTMVLALAGMSLPSFGQVFTTTHVGGGELGGNIVENSPTSFTATGGGNDIWDAADEFDFFHYDQTGDFDVRARVDSLEPAARWSKAGLMARESLAGDSRMVFNRVTPTGPTLNADTGANDSRTAYRTGNTGGAGTNDGQHEDGTGEPGFPNAWLRLQRVGSVINGYASPDGFDWRLQQTLDTATWQAGALPDTILLGLGVSRHGSAAAGELATAEIRDFADISTAPATITRQPQDATTAVGVPVSFSFGSAGGYDHLTIQWMANGVDIPGATQPVLTLSSPVLGDNGVGYSARITSTVNGSTAITGSGVLTVLDDVEAPTLVTARAPSFTKVEVRFSESVTDGTALDPFNYGIDGPTQPYITQVSRVSSTTVQLSLDAKLEPNAIYAVVVSGVSDGAGNAIAEGSTIEFQSPSFSRGWIKREYHGVTPRFNSTDAQPTGAYGGGGVGDLQNVLNTPGYPDDTITYECYSDRAEFNNYDEAESYLMRLVGFYIPDVSGAHTFYMSSDDYGELWLSTDDDPANAQLIATEPVWNGRRAWSSVDRRNAADPENRSDPIELVAGQFYYIEAIAKEGGGGDNLGFAVQVPGQDTPPANGSLPALGINLASITAGLNSSVTITADPQGTTVGEFASASLSVGYDASTDACLGVGTETPNAVVGWQIDRHDGAGWVNIPGAQGNPYVTPPLPLTANGYSYRAVVMVPGAPEATSGEAVVNVVNDVDPPGFTRVFASDFTTVEVVFNELVTDSALDPFGYTISGPTAAVVTQVIRISGTTVQLKLDASLAADATYTLFVSGVEDFIGNVIPENTPVEFQAPFYSRGFIKREYHGVVPRFNSVDAQPGGIFGGSGSGDLNTVRNNPSYPEGTVNYSCYSTRADFNEFDEAESYLMRLVGFYRASESGPHTFYMSSDDYGELWLSTNEDPANAQLIAMEPTWNGRRAWASTDRRNAADPENRSDPINLVAGQYYYIEALAKEGGGGDNLGFTVQKPGDDTPPANGEPSVPGVELAVIVTDVNSSITITENPVGGTVTENSSLTFSANADASTDACIGVGTEVGGVVIGWQVNRNDGNEWVDVPGAQGRTYTTPPLQLTMSGWRYRAQFFLPGAAASSDEAAVQVIEDLEAPFIVSAASVDGIQIGVRLNELVTDSVNDPFGWEVNGGANTVTEALLRPDGRTILVKVSPALTPGPFTIASLFLQDLADNVNTGSSVEGSMWMEGVADIGGPAPAGQHFSDQPGSVTVMAGGADVWGTSDQFTYVFKQESGNYDYKVRVDRLDHVGNNWAKGGLNVRESLDPGAATLNWVYPTPTSGANAVEGARRATAGGDMADVGQPREPVNQFPMWVRVRRVGSVASAYWSRDGQTWTPSGAENQDVPGYPQATYLGLGTVSHLNGTATTAVFSEFGPVNNYPDAVITLTGPDDASVATGNPHTLVVNATVQNAPADQLWYEWQMNVGGTWESLVVPNSPQLEVLAPAIGVTDQYRVIVSAGGSNPETSRVASVTGILDIVPPTLVSAGGDASFLRIRLRYSEPVDPGTSQDPFGYGVADSGGGTYFVTQVLPGASSSEVVIVLDATTPMPAEEVITVTVNGVLDNASNEIAPNSTISFQSWVYSTGFSLREIYDNVTIDGNGDGDSVDPDDLRADPKYPDSPDEVNYHTLLEGPTDIRDNYGIRVSGWLQPQASGAYDFFISSDDGSEFWLSTDDSPANTQLVAFEPVWNGSRQWVTTDRRNVDAPENRSTTLFPDGISLVAGQRYYYEALMKEGGGGDNVGVTSIVHGNPLPNNGDLPIGGAFNLVAVADPNGAGINITQQPQDTIAGVNCGAAGDSATASFSVAATGFTASVPDHALFIQWQKSSDGGGSWANVPGGNSATLNTTVSSADDGALFRASIHVPGAETTSDAATVNITQAPQVAITTPPDGSTGSICVDAFISASASDPDGSVVRVEFFAEGVGSLGADTDGSDGWSVTLPSAILSPGVFVLTAVATDNLGVSCTSAQAVVTLTDETPVCQDSTVTVTEDTSVTFNLVASDDDTSLTYAVVGGPSAGTLSVNPATGQATYAGAANYCGPDSFTFQVTDPCGNASGVCTVTINVVCVNDPPTCAPVTAETCEEQAVDIILSGSDVEGDALTYSIATGPGNGTVSISGNVASYTPAANFSGTDTFTYLVTDTSGASSAPCPVSITVISGNHSPVAVIEVAPTLDLGPNVPGILVLSPNNVGACVTLDGTASSDADGDTLSYVWLVDGVPVGTDAVLENVCLPAGAREVTLVVDDGSPADGPCDSPSTGETTVVVEVMLLSAATEELIMQVDEASLISRKNKQQFFATLKNATASFDRGSYGAGINQLESFQNKVRAQLKDDPSTAEEWIRIAQEIIDGAQTPVDCDGCVE